MNNFSVSARHYWEALASAGIAAQQRHLLTTYFLPLLPAGGRFLDVACVDVGLTELLARGSEEAVGWLSAEEHRKQLSVSPNSNLRFEMGGLSAIGEEGYERVVGLGLFTGVTSAESFVQGVGMLASLVSHGGYLLLQDSLMLNGTQVDAPEASYRSEGIYLAEFVKQGLQLVQRAVVAHHNSDVSDGPGSVLYLLRRPMPFVVEATAGADFPRRRIAILHQLPESWGNVRSVWSALKQDPTLDVQVILLPFLHEDYQWSRQTSESFLREQGIAPLYWEDVDLTQAGFDAVLFTSPYDHTRPYPFQFHELKKWVRHTAYVPYGLEVGGGESNMALQFGQPVALHASAIYVRSEGAKAMYTRHCPTGDRHVVVTGHPRMDGLANLDEFPVDPLLLEQIGDRRAVLWNAHFSFDGDHWSTFDLLAMDIFAAFEARPELVLLFRPHPLLWKKLLNLGLLDEDGIETLRLELGARGVILDERADHRHVFAASSAMLSDAGSFLMEYLVTGKPLLYLSNPYGLGLNEEGEAVARYYDRAEDAAGIAAFLDGLASRDADDVARRKAVIPEFFFGFDGQAGRRVAEHLKGLCA